MMDSVKKAWGKVMTQAPIIQDNPDVFKFMGKNGGYVIVDANLFTESIIMIEWSKSEMFGRDDIQYLNK